MDKNTPVVQGYNLYVETVAKKLNSKNLDGEPLYALLGKKKVRRKVLAGPYKNMRDLMAEMLETNILDEEFISQFGSIILNAATMDEDGNYHFDVDIAECKATDNAILVNFSLQAYVERNEMPDNIDIMPILNFYRYGAILGKYPESMDAVDKLIENIGDSIVEEDRLVAKVPDVVKALSAEKDPELFADKYLLVGYGSDGDDDEEVVLSSPVSDLGMAISMASAGNEAIGDMLSEVFSQLRIKKLSLNDEGKIEASTYVSIPILDISTPADMSYAFVEAIVNTHYNGNWDAAEKDLGELPKKHRGSENEHCSSIKQADEPVLYFITGEYNDRYKPSETLFTSDDPNKLAELILNAHGAARVFIKEYDSLAVGIAIDRTAFIKLTVFDKHQENNSELAVMAFILAETMTHARLCMDECKYDVDYEGFRDLTRLAALSFAGAKKEEMEETEDGE